MMKEPTTGLALDGGGVFGIGQAAILAETDLSKFDCIGGTSIGSAIACLLAQGVSQDNLVSMFQNLAPRAFSAPLKRAKFLLTPKYDDKPLNEVLQDTIKGTFGDLGKNIPLFVVGAQLDERRLKVFYSGDDDDARMPAWEVCRASVAAETYFLPWKGYGDGGIYATNPAAILAAGMMSELHTKSTKVRIASIGTGVAAENSGIASTNWWPTLKWGTYILDTLLGGGSASMHDYLVRNMVKPENYLRIQFRREEDWKMDSADDMNEALKVWAPDIAAGIKALESF
jgi:patatin-like phospholipase/acyl hydrolase